MWKYYALLSALFAALIAIFAKIGVKDINSDLATAIRTSVILVITWGIVLFGTHMGEIKDISRHAWVFLILSGIVITIFLSFILLKEPVSLKVIIGALLITGGSVLMLIK